MFTLCPGNIWRSWASATVNEAVGWAGALDTTFARAHWKAQRT